MIAIRRKGRTAFIELRRAPVNAIDEAFVDAIAVTLRELRQDQDPPSVICFESNLKVFAAGADLTFLHSLAESGQHETALETYLQKIQQLFAEIETADAITVARISGAAMGAGLELALACDLRVTCPSAKFALPEVGVGLLPAAGGTQRLTRLCGRGLAMRMICAGDVVKGSEAVASGLAQYCVDDAELPGFVEVLMERMAAKPPAALRLAKRCIHSQGTSADGYADERRAASDLLGQEDTRALIRAFVERGGRRAA